MNSGPPVLSDCQGLSKMFLDSAFQTLMTAVDPSDDYAGEQDVEAGKQEHAACLVVAVSRVNLGLQQSVARQCALHLTSDDADARP